MGFDLNKALFRGETGADITYADIASLAPQQAQEPSRSKKLAAKHFVCACSRTRTVKAPIVHEQAPGAVLFERK